MQLNATFKDVQMIRIDVSKILTDLYRLKIWKGVTEIVLVLS